MTTNELVSKVAQVAGGTKKNARLYVGAVIEAIIQAVAEGNDVKLVGLGQLKIVDRPARDSFNIVTKKVQTVPAGKTLKFKLSKNVRALVK